MPIIDYTNFIGKLSLPQTGNTAGLTLINQFIGIYEPEYLKKALGYDLWKAFTEGIQGSGTDQRWIDLLDGKEFEYAGRNYKWNGFDPDDKLTPIVNYVYYKYMEEKASDNTLAGVATGAVDNNTRVSPMVKMVDAWNSMADMNKLLWMFLTANRDTYPEWNYWQGTWEYWTTQDACVQNEVYYYKNTLDL